MNSFRQLKSWEEQYVETIPKHMQGCMHVILNISPPPPRFIQIWGNTVCINMELGKVDEKSQHGLSKTVDQVPKYLNGHFLTGH